MYSSHIIYSMALNEVLPIPNTRLEGNSKFSKFISSSNISEYWFYNFTRHTHLPTQLVIHPSVQLSSDDEGLEIHLSKHTLLSLIIPSCNILCKINTLRIWILNRLILSILCDSYKEAKCIATHFPSAHPTDIHISACIDLDKQPKLVKTDNLYTYTCMSFAGNK